LTKIDSFLLFLFDEQFDILTIGKELANRQLQRVKELKRKCLSYLFYNFKVRIDQGSLPKQLNFVEGIEKAAWIKKTREEMKK
jgi:hypothetical protein